MRYALAALAGVAGAIAGWAIAGGVALGLAGLAGMSDFEGGRGMFAFLGIGPLGGLLGMIAAVWWALRRGQPSVPRGRLAARTAAVLAAIAGLTGVGLWLWAASGDTYTDRLPPTLEFELRVPASVDPRGVEVELHTDRNVGERVQPETASADAAGRILAGRVALAFKTSSRLLVVSVAGEPRRLFALRLARDPASTPALGDWQPPQFLDDPGDAQPRQAPAGDPFALRYRVRRAGED